MAGPEWWNYDYPNPEIADFESNQRQEELDALSGSEILEPVSQVVEGWESEQWSVERTENIRSLLSQIETIPDLDGIDGFDVFSQYLLTASTEIQELLLRLDPSQQENLIATIISSNKYPVNDFEFQQSIIEGTILEAVAEVEWTISQTTEAIAEVEWTISQTTEAVAEVEWTNTETAEAIVDGSEVENEGLEEILRRKEQILQVLSVNSEFSYLINEFNNLEDNDYIGLSLQNDRVIQILSQPNILETQILPQAQAQWPEVYAQVRESLINLWGWERVDEINDEAEQSGNIFSLQTYSGEIVEYDAVADERSLMRDGYRISSEVEDTGDYQTPKLEYMRVEQEHMPMITLIQTAIRAIEEKQIDTWDLAEIQATLQGIPNISSLGIDFESMDSWEAIQAAFNSAFTYHSWEINEARDEYHDALIGLRDGHRAALEKRDRKVKKVLKFFESIGFTDIPQYITDQVVETLNSNDSLRAQLWFNEIIDFENGQLWIDNNAWESEDLDLEDRKSFAEFVNKMLWVTDSDWNPPINVGAIWSSSPLTSITGQEWEARFKMLIEESWILLGWAWKAIENLSRREEEQ